MKTMICLLLDRSGSMSGRESDVISGVNKFIEDQKTLKEPACMAFVRFDTSGIERFRPMTPLEEVEPLRRKDFIPAGGTPLLDAIGRTINELDKDWVTEKPDRAIMIIVTDGAENASKEFTKDKVKALIEARQNSKLWAFIYLGANVDAFSEAGSMGIHMANSAGYTSSAVGTQSMYSTVSASAKYMRATGQSVAHNLGKQIDEDEADPNAASVQSAWPVNQSANLQQMAPPAQTPADPTPWTPPAPKPAATWTPPA